MSQYPNPYSSQPPSPYNAPGAAPYPSAHIPAYGQPGGDMLGGARRAGVLQIVLGSLLVIVGLCMGAFAFLLPLEEIYGPTGPMPMPPSFISQVRVGATVLCIGAMLFAVLMIVLGVFVRKGGKGAVVGSIVLNALLLIGCLLYLALTIASPIPSGSAQIRTGVSMVIGLMLIPPALLIWLIAWLFLSLKGIGQAQAIQQQYQAQYYQYQQQQQMYAQGGAGQSQGGNWPPAPPPPQLPPSL